MRLRRARIAFLAVCVVVGLIALVGGLIGAPGMWFTFVAMVLTVAHQLFALRADARPGDNDRSSGGNGAST